MAQRNMREDGTGAPGRNSGSSVPTIRSGGQRLRCGFTTGTCAALAASGAARLLLTGQVPRVLSLYTPAGILVEAEPLQWVLEEGAARCAVRKDAGDDPDVTDGCLVSAEVRFLPESPDSSLSDGAPSDIPSSDGASSDSPSSDGAPADDKFLSVSAVSPGRSTSGGSVFIHRTSFESDVISGIQIDGGAGVGRVTKPGLDQPVGAAAINSVPRRMIAQAVDHIRREAGYGGGLSVVISVPGGEALARRTLNASLGVEGGVSILGTSGIVEPMSSRALIDTIELQLRQAALSGETRLMLTPGNYGMEFLRHSGILSLGIPCVKCSNYIGDALDLAAEAGFRTILLAGHIGKLVKVAGGILNTHSQWADCRCELFCAHGAVCGADAELCRNLLDAVTTDACVTLLDRAGLREAVMTSLLKAVQRHLNLRFRWGTEEVQREDTREVRSGEAGETGEAQRRDTQQNGSLPVERGRVGAMTFSQVHGFLGATATAVEILTDWGIPADLLSPR